jgi:hypothetical protein
MQAHIVEKPFLLMRRISSKLAPMRPRFRTLEYAEGGLTDGRVQVDLPPARRRPIPVSTACAAGPHYPPAQTPWEFTPGPLMFIEGRPALDPRDITRRLVIRTRRERVLLPIVTAVLWLTWAVALGMTYRLG